MNRRASLSVLAILAAIAAASCTNMLTEALSADRRFVEEDAAALAPDLAAGDEAAAVTTDIQLPIVTDEGTTITWSSSHPDILDIDGTVHRPPFDQGAVVVTLTATLTCGSACTTKEFVYTIQPLDPTNDQAVEAAAETALDDAFSGTDGVGGVTGDLSLPSSGDWGTAITWASSDDAVVDPGSGEVARPPFGSGDTTVTLTATVTKDGQTFTESFTVTIVEAPGIYFEGNGSDGGIAVSPQALATGASAALTANSFTKSGATFAGWNTRADGAGTSYADCATYTMESSAPVTLYASWSTGTFTINYSGNGNTAGAAPDASSYDFGAVATAAAQGSLSRNGYEFDGWNTSANGSGTDRSAGEQFTMPATNLTLHAQWSIVAYTVSYNLAGGTNAAGNPATYTVADGTITLEDPVRGTYVFGGWYDNGAYTGSPVTEITTGGTGDMALYAKWTATATVSYNGNGATGGAAPANQTKIFNVPLALSGNTNLLTMPAYVFSGWNTAADGSGTAYAAGASYTANASATMYAVWMPEHYGITYTLNGGVNHASNPSWYTVEDAGIPIQNPTRAGYVFAGWYAAADFSGSVVTSIPSGSSGAKAFYAKWLATYTVNYDANASSSGTAPSSQTKVETVTLSLASNSGLLAKTGYTFNGWNTATDGSGTHYAVGGNYTANASDTLYAEWEPLTYAVAYSANGGSGNASPASQTKSYDIDLALASQGTMTRAGYAFNGWNTASDGSGTSFAAGATYTANASLILYAQWLAQYSVSYNGNGATGGSAPASQTKTQGVNLILATAGTLSRTGYYVASWNTLPGGGGTSYSLGGNYTADAGTTLYAQWQIQTYTIAYSDHWGTHTNPASYTINSGEITLTAPSNGPADHNWIGWVDPSLGASDATLGMYMPGNKVTTIPAGSTGNRTFYAWYEPIPRVTDVYFINQAGNSNYINIGDYIQINLSAPLGSGCHPGLVRGGGQIGFNGSDPDKDGSILMYSGTTDWISYYDTNGGLYNLNMGWLNSTDAYVSAANGVNITLLANLSANGRTLYLYITNWSMNPADQFQVFSAATTVYFTASGHWQSIGGKYYNTNAVYNGNWSLW